MPRASGALASAFLIVVALTAPALADDDPQFRRTTPRGSFGRDGPVLSVGVPGGRAWGIESELRAVPDERSAFRATIEVSDPAVREAFVRIAWYDRMAKRPRQFSLTDARLVRAGESATLEITLDPPPRAVAYRIRVLARLRSPDALSRPDAVRAVLGDLRASPRYPQTRLLR
jgi:hypothetical protein